MEVVDAVTGAEVDRVGFDDTIKIKAKVTGPDGQPAPGRRITSRFNNEQCRFIDSSDGSGVTDANGQVEMSFKLVSGSTAGSDKLTVISDLPVDRDDEPPMAAKSFEIDRTTAAAGTIEFVSATPSLIGLSGIGVSTSLPSQSLLEFIVKDDQANPVCDQTVNFSLTTSVGGLSLEPASAQTDSEGKVTVGVNSGRLPTSVRVKAEVEYTSLAALSNKLILSTGFPDQNSFSISAETLTPEGMYYDGERVNITIRAADMNNNPVPDGTAVYFTTEGGAIQSSGFTKNGLCTVEWRSQEPRPDDGLVTILAYAQGEESFQDMDSNGFYERDTDRLLTDMPEAFLDADYDGTRDYSEKFIDFNNDQEYTPKNGIYNGTLCDPESTNCSNDLVHVWSSIEILMADSYADIEFSPSGTISFTDLHESIPIDIRVSGRESGKSMPSGTKVKVTAPASALINGGENDGETMSFKVGSGFDPSEFRVILVPRVDDEGVYVTGTSGSLMVEVTTPNNCYSMGYLTVYAPPNAH
ncbi:MAG: hypothetical protein GY737_07320 [Desulfobacteraceae bacterium]|nr:hypothetical protein [Desulfobacteraceae bacterium]